MAGALHEYLSADHEILAGLLERSPGESGSIDMETYGRFRAGLLKHIGVEEKILFPACRQKSGEPLPLETKIRLDHGALAALLVPTPSLKIISVMRVVLSSHNGLEEDPGGVYDACDQRLGSDAAGVLAEIRRAGEVPVHPYNDGPGVIEAVRRAVLRAGYEFDALYR